MKPIKTFLCILTVVCMIFPCFAAEASDSFEPSEYTQAVGLMTDLGIIDEQYSSYDTSAYMTRGEFAHLIINMLGLGSISGSSAVACKFSDVPPDHPYAASISLAVSLGYFSGTSSDKFEPDSPVYISQAIKVAVTVLGYADYASQNGGYPAGYLVAAEYADILGGVNLNDSYASQRGNVIVLLANTVCADMTETFLLADGSYTVEKREDVTILSEYHHIYSDEGIITADSQMSLDGDICGEGYIAIDGDVMKSVCKEPYGSVGMRVEYYYRNTNGKKELVTFRRTDNYVILINASDDYTYTSSDKKYTVSDGKSFKLSDGFDLIYNNIPVDGTDLLDVSSLMQPVSGTIKLIDNTSDGKYDVVAVSKARILVFGGYDKYNNIIRDSEDSTQNTDLDGYDEYVVKDTSSQELSVEDIREGSIVMLFESANGKNAELTVCNDTVSGTVTEKDSDGDIMIDGIEYKISPGSRNASGLVPGIRCTVYLDSYGDIVYRKILSNMRTGYIVGTKTDSKGVDKEIMVKMISSSDGTEVFSLCDKVTVTTPFDSKKLAKEEVPDKLSALKADIYPAVDSSNMGVFVMFDISSDGKISEIKLPYVISTEDEYLNPPSGYDFFRLDYLVAKAASVSTNMSFTKSNLSLGLSIALDDAAMIYFVPVVGDDSYDEKNYGVKSASLISNGFPFKASNVFAGLENQMELYSTGESVKLADCVVYSCKSASLLEITDGYNNNLLVTALKHSLSSDGDEIWKLEGLENGKPVSLYLDDEYIMTRDSMMNVKLEDGVSPYIRDDKPELQCGDIIKYGVGSDGYVKSIALLYDACGQKLPYTDPTSYITFNAQYRYTGGYVSDIYLPYAELMLLGKTDEYFAEPHRLNAFARIYIYDFKTEEAFIGTADDVSVDDRVFVVDNYRTPRELFVFKGGKSK